MKLHEQWNRITKDPCRSERSQRAAKPNPDKNPRMKTKKDGQDAPLYKFWRCADGALGRDYVNVGPQLSMRIIRPAIFADTDSLVVGDVQRQVRMRVGAWWQLAASQSREHVL